MSGTIIINGEGHPVTSKFQTEVLDKHPDLATRNYGELVSERDKLLHISMQRNNLDEPTPDEPLAPHGTLTIAEQLRLDNITHVINVHNGVKFLRGKSHTAFGFDGVDQVHGNSHRLECGCVDHYVFDHHKRHEEGATVHFHRAHARCAAHKDAT